METTSFKVVGKLLTINCYYKKHSEHFKIRIQETLDRLFVMYCSLIPSKCICLEHHIILKVFEGNLNI